MIQIPKDWGNFPRLRDAIMFAREHCDEGYFGQRLNEALAVDQRSLALKAEGQGLGWQSEADRENYLAMIMTEQISIGS